MENIIAVSYTHLDNMLASDDYDINGHQVYVNKGTTTIILYYPYFTQGMLLSAGALVAAILLSLIHIWLCIRTVIFSLAM